MFSSKYSIGVILVAFCVITNASLAPSVPEPGTVWQAGKEYEIIWVRRLETQFLTNFLDLMTGDNDDQVFLDTIASNMSGSDSMSYKWVVPEVDPHANIYFLMFTNDQDEVAWTTRFTIVGPDNVQEEPEKSIQPDGQKIPWGIGKLVEGPREASNGGDISAAAISSAAGLVSEDPSMMSIVSSQAQSSTLQSSQAATTSVATTSAPSTSSISSASALSGLINFTALLVSLTVGMLIL
ncbi:hypothetical protein CLU79DRAFT_702634 [Phycomyces nitens]|nr:hypothetical protein CLU79DRAFT_702634 [Phycomyces nitens]